MYNPLLDKVLGISTLTVSLKKDRLLEMGELLALSSIAFFVPFLFSNQLLVGVMVNSSLIGGALYMKGKNLLPLIMLPSIGLLARGLAFGPMTMYLFYMLPFIWIGNASLILSMKLFHLKMKKSYAYSAIAGSVIKFAILSASAFALYSFGIIPAAFLATMGIMQLATALAGSVAFYPVKEMRKKN